MRSHSLDLAAIAAIAAAVLALALAFRVPPEDGVLFLFTVPVALVAWRHGELAAAAPPPSPDTPLTARVLDVLRLIAS
jgi:hypothetical protein